MRLIDADKLKKELSTVWKWLVDRNNAGYGTTHGEMLDKVHDIITSQPTAYDIDKVVSSLEEQKDMISLDYMEFLRRRIWQRKKDLELVQ